MDVPRVNHMTNMQMIGGGWRVEPTVVTRIVSRLTDEESPIAAGGRCVSLCVGCVGCVECVECVGLPVNMLRLRSMAKAGTIHPVNFNGIVGRYGAGSRNWVELGGLGGRWEGDLISELRRLLIGM